MHGDEHVGAELARLARAPAQRNEVIAVADEHGAHAFLRIDSCGELASQWRA